MIWMEGKAEVELVDMVLRIKKFKLAEAKKDNLALAVIIRRAARRVTDNNCESSFPVISDCDCQQSAWVAEGEGHTRRGARARIGMVGTKRD